MKLNIYIILIRTFFNSINKVYWCVNKYDMKPFGRYNRQFNSYKIVGWIFSQKTSVCYSISRVSFIFKYFQCELISKFNIKGRQSVATFFCWMNNFVAPDRLNVTLVSCLMAVRSKMQSWEKTADCRGSSPLPVGIKTLRQPLCMAALRYQAL